MRAPTEIMTMVEACRPATTSHLISWCKFFKVVLLCPGFNSSPQLKSGKMSRSEVQRVKICRFDVQDRLRYDDDII